MQRRTKSLADKRFAGVLALAVALLLGACASGSPARPGTIGLFTSLPIIWPETQDIKGLLRSDAPPHWALAALGKRGALRPLDTLAPHDGQTPLAGIGLLVMAQPRPLSPQENLALDGWVRRGGRAVLFADPLLTQESAFALGDRRQPQQIALLSPILTRWGLTLHFDEDQPGGEQVIAVLGGPYPVNLPGTIAAARDSPNCAPQPGGAAILALCRIGTGRVLVIADAALFEDGTAGDHPLRVAALERVLAAIER